MQRFKQPNMDLHPDGEWIRYEDHVEAMKRIAGAPVAQGLTDEQIEAIWQTTPTDGIHYIYGEPAKELRIRFARAILAQAAPSASAQQAVVWCLVNARGEIQTWVTPCFVDPRNGGLDCIRKDADRQEADGAPFAWKPLVFAAPAPSASPDDEWEIRADGQRVRKDRWQDGFRSIVSIVRGPRGSFEIPEIIEQVRALVKASESAAPAALTAEHFAVQLMMCRLAEILEPNHFHEMESIAHRAGIYPLASAPECTCPSGNGSLRHPCPLHPVALAASPADRGEDARDAERYRWLRNSKTDLAKVIDKVVGEMPYDEATRTGGYPIYEYRAGEELDAAIDAAMSASKEGA